jgi:hypothetical protein
MPVTTARKLPRQRAAPGARHDPALRWAIRKGPRSAKVGWLNLPSCRDLAARAPQPDLVGIWEGNLADAIRRLLRPLHRLLRSPTNPHRDRPGFARSVGERLVFIGGVPRSGTTLLQHMLDCHSQVFGGPEFDCIPGIARTWRQVAGAHQRGRIDVFGTREQIDAAFARLIEDLLLPVADARWARLLSEKTPLNVLVFIDLLALLPECRIIHLVRDPRAVVSSLLQVGLRSQARGEPAPDYVKSLQGALRFTAEALDAGFRAAEQFPERVLTLRYEALVSEPEVWARQACAFLGLAFEPAMLQPQAKKHPAQDAIVALDKGVWLDPALGIRPIEPSRIRAWQDFLSPVQSNLGSAAFRDHPRLHALGYRFD